MSESKEKSTLLECISRNTFLKTEQKDKLLSKILSERVNPVYTSLTSKEYLDGLAVLLFVAQEVRTRFELKHNPCDENESEELKAAREGYTAIKELFLLAVMKESLQPKETT